MCVWLGPRPRVGVGSPWGSRPLGWVVTRDTSLLRRSPRAGQLSPRTGTQRSLYATRALLPISSRNRESLHFLFEQQKFGKEKIKETPCPTCRATEAKGGPEDAPRFAGQSAGAQRGGQAGAQTETRVGGAWARMQVCRTRVRVTAPAARWWACTHVDPRGTPAAWIALRGKTSQSHQAPAWLGEGRPMDHPHHPFLVPPVVLGPPQLTQRGRWGRQGGYSQGSPGSPRCRFREGHLPPAEERPRLPLGIAQAPGGARGASPAQETPPAWDRPVCPRSGAGGPMPMVTQGPQRPRADRGPWRASPDPAAGTLGSHRETRPGRGPTRPRGLGTATHPLTHQPRVSRRSCGPWSSSGTLRRAGGRLGKVSEQRRRRRRGPAGL